MKSFLMTWLGAFLLVTALLYALGPLMTDWPVWARALLLSGLMVFAMQRAMGPLISALNANTSKLER